MSGDKKYYLCTLRIRGCNVVDSMLVSACNEGDARREVVQRWGVIDRRGDDIAFLHVNEVKECDWGMLDGVPRIVVDYPPEKNVRYFHVTNDWDPIVGYVAAYDVEDCRQHVNEVFGTCSDYYLEEVERCEWERGIVRCTTQRVKSHWKEKPDCKGEEADVGDGMMYFFIEYDNEDGVPCSVCGVGESMIEVLRMFGEQRKGKVRSVIETTKELYCESSGDQRLTGGTSSLRLGVTVDMEVVSDCVEKWCEQYSELEQRIEEAVCSIVDDVLGTAILDRSCDITSDWKG